MFLQNKVVFLFFIVSSMLHFSAGLSANDVVYTENSRVQSYISKKGYSESKKSKLMSKDDLAYDALFNFFENKKASFKGEWPNFINQLYGKAILFETNISQDQRVDTEGVFNSSSYSKHDKMWNVKYFSKLKGLGLLAKSDYSYLWYKNHKEYLNTKERHEYLVQLFKQKKLYTSALNKGLNLGKVCRYYREIYRRTPVLITKNDIPKNCKLRPLDYKGRIKSFVLLDQKSNAKSVIEFASLLPVQKKELEAYFYVQTGDFIKAKSFIPKNPVGFDFNLRMRIYRMVGDFELMETAINKKLSLYKSKRSRRRNAQKYLENYFYHNQHEAFLKLYYKYHTLLQNRSKVQWMRSLVYFIKEDPLKAYKILKPFQLKYPHNESFTYWVSVYGTYTDDFRKKSLEKLRVLSQNPDHSYYGLLSKNRIKGAEAFSKFYRLKDKLKSIYVLTKKQVRRVSSIPIGRDSDGLYEMHSQDKVYFPQLPKVRLKRIKYKSTYAKYAKINYKDYHERLRFFFELSDSSYFRAELRALYSEVRSNKYLANKADFYDYLSQLSHMLKDPYYIAKFNDLIKGRLGMDQFLFLYPTAYSDVVKKVSASIDFDSSMIHSIMRAESFYNPKAYSSAHAFGLLQILYPTAKKLEKIYYGNTLTSENFFTEKRYQDNIKIGSTYLKRLATLFNNHPVLVAAGYNAGPHRVKLWVTRGNTKINQDVFVEMIPFSQTRNYVKKVLRFKAIYDFKISKQQDYVATINPFEPFDVNLLDKGPYYYEKWDEKVDFKIK